MQDICGARCGTNQTLSKGAMNVLSFENSHFQCHSFPQEQAVLGSFNPKSILIMTRA